MYLLNISGGQYVIWTYAYQIQIRGDFSVYYYYKELTKLNS